MADYEKYVRAAITSLFTGLSCGFTLFLNSIDPALGIAWAVSYLGSVIFYIYKAGKAYKHG